MHLTKHTDYSLRVLIYLAITSDHKVTISEMAERYAVSKNHLVKVVHKLATLGFVNSTQGRGGGLSLGKAVDKIVVGDVVRKMESTLEVIDCAAEECPLLPSCRLKTALNRATKAFLKELDNFTLEDLVKNKSTLVKLLD